MTSYEWSGTSETRRSRFSEIEGAGSRSNLDGERWP